MLVIVPVLVMLELAFVRGVADGHLDRCFRSFAGYQQDRQQGRVDNLELSGHRWIAARTDRRQLVHLLGLLRNVRPDTNRFGCNRQLGLALGVQDVHGDAPRLVVVQPLGMILVVTQDHDVAAMGARIVIVPVMVMPVPMPVIVSMIVSMIMRI